MSAFGQPKFDVVIDDPVMDKMYNERLVACLLADLSRRRSNGYSVKKRAVRPCEFWSLEEQASWEVI